MKSASHATGSEFSESQIDDKSGNHSPGPTVIADLCSKADGLAVLMDIGADNEDPDNAAIRDTAFERVCSISDEIAQRQSSAPSDLLRKIQLWKRMTQEDTLDPAFSSPDERLLNSIVSDIEKQLLRWTTS